MLAIKGFAMSDGYNWPYMAGTEAKDARKQSYN
jgi:hypothetical protein